MTGNFASPKLSFFRKGMMTMANPLTTPTITEGQIGRILEVFGARLRKDGRDFSLVLVQEVLGQSDFGDALLAVLRRRIEALSDLIVRRVTVNRSRTLQKAIDATGRKKYLKDEVVASAPGGMGEEVELFFFKVGRYLTDVELKKEFDSRDLVPADPHSLSAANEADPAFADDHPNGCHWQDADGKWCFAVFDRWNGERCVSVHRNRNGWLDSWWCVGVRK